MPLPILGVYASTIILCGLSGPAIASYPGSLWATKSLGTRLGRQ